MFVLTLSELPIVAVRGHIEEDIRSLSEAFSDEHEFVSALHAISAELRLIVGDPNRGSSLHGHYAAWKYSKFQSRRSQHHPADLRIIFRRVSAAGAGHVELRAFGHRWHPVAIYLRGKDR
ncbi:MAG: hypothetical protein ACYCOS_08815 [Sulfobacillus sp.]